VDQAYLHTLDPVAFSLGPVTVKWYPLTYITGFVIAYVLWRWLIKTRRSVIPKDYLGDVIAYFVFAVAVGARLGYVLFYRPELLIDFSADFPFWGVLALHKGGMSSHGGMLGVIAACFYIHRERGIPKMHLFDVTALVAPPGLGLGRLGNWVNGELWGKALPASQQTYAGGSSPWWSVKYPAELSEPGFDQSRFASAADAIKEHLFLPADTDLATVIDSAVRAMEGGDDHMVALLQPALTAYYPSPLFQALTDGPLMMLILVIVWWRPRLPGTVGAWFFISYGILRISSEVWRQPDDGVALLLGLSRGQVLSVLLTLTGCIGLYYVGRRDVPRLGGLGSVNAVDLHTLIPDDHPSRARDAKDEPPQHS
jgi:phosphatidylglycerol:prolipoprotein diacylglycerol transferase